MFVSRAAFDAVCQERDRLASLLETTLGHLHQLTQQVVRMKRQGYELARKPVAKVIPAPPEPEQRIERAISHATIMQMATDIRRERPDLTEREAVAHAEALARELDPTNAQ